MAKRYTASAQIGEAGLRLVSHLVAGRLGFIWHDRRVDHGIDGEIELVDSSSGTPLNAIVLVQSKAQDRPFPGETVDAFHYLCDERDIDYWMGGNAPVILVCSHPQTGEAWWASVKDVFADPARRRSRRVDFVKAQARFDETAAPQLLGLAIPIESGTYLRPPPLPEKLVSNLLRVDRVADTIWFAPAAVKQPREAAELLRRKASYCSDWVLTDGMVWSFRRVDEPPLSLLIDGSAEGLETREWSAAKDLDAYRRFVRLLNQTLIEVTHRDLRRHPKGWLFFRPTGDLQVRRIATGHSRRGRVVFQGYPDKKEPGRIRWYRHHALEFQFVRHDEAWYLALRPTYHFTFDGWREVPWAPDLAAEMKRRERNAAVRGLVRFWATYLRARPTLFGDADWRLQFGELLTFDVDRGIDDSAWTAAEPEILEAQVSGNLKLFGDPT